VDDYRVEDVAKTPDGPGFDPHGAEADMGAARAVEWGGSDCPDQGDIKI
jgi:hypothetical protein